MREGWGQSHSSSQISFSACRGLNSKFQGSPSRPPEQVLVFTSTSPEMNPKGAERRNSISHLKPEVENPLYFLGSHLCVPLSERWLLKLTSIESVMPSNHLILCRALLLPPSIFPSIRVFSNESMLNYVEERMEDTGGRLLIS